MSSSSWISTRVDHLFLCIILMMFFACTEKEDPISISTFQKIASLPIEINECSGMTFINDQLVTINDGGAGPVLFFTDTADLATVTTATIQNIQNRDWETIIDDGTHYWIGDFGNNFGSRMDLIIYKVAIASLMVEDSIKYTYPDQTSFMTPLHNYDCEAMIKKDDTILLFSKNRLDNRSTVYKIDLVNSSISLIQSLVVPARVTDAFYHEKSDHLILLCNDMVDGIFKSYIEVFDFGIDLSLSHSANFSIPFDEQFEAITLQENNTFYIGSENENGSGGNIYSFTLEGI